MNLCGFGDCFAFKCWVVLKVTFLNFLVTCSSDQVFGQIEFL
jgi:hypothetical protein